LYDHLIRVGLVSMIYIHCERFCELEIKPVAAFIYQWKYVRQNTNKN